MSETPNQDKSQADGPEADGPGVPTDAAPAPNDELQQAQRQRDDYFDQLQRTRAEFNNYQKRSRTQAEADRLHAVGPLATDLLDVLDNFERAIEAARAAGAPKIVEGLDMVYKQLVATLTKHGIEPIAALGQPFDPHQHESLVQQHHADRPEGTIVAELGKGYKLRDRVLRPAKVAVSVRPAE